MSESKLPLSLPEKLFAFAKFILVWHLFVSKKFGKNFPSFRSSIDLMDRRLLFYDFFPIGSHSLFMCFMTSCRDHKSTIRCERVWAPDLLDSKPLKRYELKRWHHLYLAFACTWLLSTVIFSHFLRRLHLGRKCSMFTINIQSTRRAHFASLRLRNRKKVKLQRSLACEMMWGFHVSSKSGCHAHMKFHREKWNMKIFCNLICVRPLVCCFF